MGVLIRLNVREEVSVQYKREDRRWWTTETVILNREKKGKSHAPNLCSVEEEEREEDKEVLSYCARSAFCNLQWKRQNTPDTPHNRTCSISYVSVKCPIDGYWRARNCFYLMKGKSVRAVLSNEILV